MATHSDIDTSLACSHAASLIAPASRLIGRLVRELAVAGRTEDTAHGGPTTYAPAHVGHSIFEFRRGAPNTPPQRFGFKKIAQRMIGVFLLHALCRLHSSGDVEGIDFVEDGGRLGWQSEFDEAGRRGKRREQKKNERGGAECWHQRHDLSLLPMSLSGLSKVANGNGRRRRICVRRHGEHLLFSADPW